MSNVGKIIKKIMEEDMPEKMTFAEVIATVHTIIAGYDVSDKTLDIFVNILQLQMEERDVEGVVIFIPKDGNAMVSVKREENNEENDEEGDDTNGKTLH